MAEKKDTKDTAKTAAKKPAAKKPAATKAAAKKPATKPKATETKAKAAGAEKPEAKATKAEAKKPAGKKDTAKKAATSKSAPAAKKAADKDAPERPVVNARARYVRVAPRKARLIADQVRGLPLEDAQTLLRFSPRSAAQDIAKLINSAAANAENNHDLFPDELLIKDIRVDEGPTLRRYRPRALGRATRINKRTSHIQVALAPED
jgi:large subunit ribosomal protein L22